MTCLSAEAIRIALFYIILNGEGITTVLNPCSSLQTFYTGHIFITPTFQCIVVFRQKYFVSLQYALQFLKMRYKFDIKNQFCFLIRSNIFFISLMQRTLVLLSRLKFKTGFVGQTVVIPGLPDDAQLMQPGNCAVHSSAQHRWGEGTRGC